MANEISVTVGLTATIGELSVTTQTATTRHNMTGTHSHQSVQDIGTTYEQLVVPADLATLGFARFKNLGPTNYVELGVEVAAAFYPFSKLFPGESALLPLAPGVSYFGKSNTAATKLQYTILER